MIVTFLPAFNGDCILISFKDSVGSPRNILIDGGTPATYPKGLKNMYQRLEGNIDLLVVTHIDDDHIGGIKKMFEDTRLNLSKIKKVWFNSGGLLNHYFGENEEKSRAVAIVPNNIEDVSLHQGNVLEAKLDKLPNVWVKKIIKKGDKVDVHDCMIDVLSPNEKTLSKLNTSWETETDISVNVSRRGHDDFDTDIDVLIKKTFKEDTGIPNGSSIAFLLEYQGIKGLLLGDAYPSVVAASLKEMGFSKDNKLKLDFVKVSHHASKGNTSPELLEIIRCDKFIVCTNGQKHGLPDKEAIARIIASQPECSIYFNYHEYVPNLITENDNNKYRFQLKNLKTSQYKLKF